MKGFLFSILLLACSKPQVTEEIGVHGGEFGRATAAAMSIINGFSRCEVLVPGDEVLIISDNGAPCGDPWRDEEEEGHDATAYLCGDRRWEILMSRPGDLHTQTCIIAHELGHVLGLRDGAAWGIMSSECGDYIRVTDGDSRSIRERFCK